MTAQEGNPIGKLPRWQQIALFLMLMAASFPAIDYAKGLILGSERARAIKNQLKPLAERLENAQKTGDRQTAIALFEPVTKIMNDYNALDDAKRAEINNSALRYCVLASVNLSSGINEVIESGNWLKKEQFKNALDMCK